MGEEKKSAGMVTLAGEESQESPTLSRGEMRAKLGSR